MEIRRSSDENNFDCFSRHGVLFEVWRKQELQVKVFCTIFTKSLTLVFLSVALKLNYFAEHITASCVSAPGRFVNSAL